MHGEVPLKCQASRISASDPRLVEVFTDNHRYHWAVVVGPKTDDGGAEGRRFHAKERMAVEDGRLRSVWEFEERTTSMDATAMIMARILFAKVSDSKRLESVIYATKVKGQQPGWNCVTWVEEVLAGLEEDGKALGSCVTDWKSIRDAAMRFVEAKRRQHRYDGLGQFDGSKVATWSMLEGQELVP